MPPDPQLEMTRYRASRRPPGHRHNRVLLWLVILMLAVALIAEAGLAMASKSPHRPKARGRRVSHSFVAHPGTATTLRLADDFALRGRITTILKADGFAGATSSLGVVDLSTATALFERHSQTELMPASNEKLVTSATALADWGSDYRFKTELLTSGTVSAKGVFTGQIYLKGFGDPSLSTTSYQTHVLHLATSKLSDFVTALRKAGVRKIVGRVTGDDSYFDAARTVAWWKPTMAVYCGPLSALSLNEDIQADGHRTSDPPQFVARELTALLRESGIPVSRSGVAGVTPTTAKLLYTEHSAPLWRILAAMNKSSDNFFAETLAKGLGATFGDGGTTAAGVKVERAFLIAEGLSAKTFRLTDGSGLSYADRLTTPDITTLLAAMLRRSDWRTFWHSLSLAGVDGTLADRMRGTAAQGDLHGKTGTLDDASNLSGYVKSANGEWLVFSLLMNENDIDVGEAHAAQDAIGVALAGSRPPGKTVWSPSPAL